MDIETITDVCRMDQSEIHACLMAKKRTTEQSKMKIQDEETLSITKILLYREMV
jgi:hypothetical protein